MAKIAILFLLTYLGGLLATLTIDVSWGICLYELQYFINPVIRWWYGSLPDLRYSFTIAAFIAIAYLLRRTKYTENHLSEAPQAKWLLGFTVLMFLVGFIAVWQEKHWDLFIAHVKLILFLCVAYKTIDNPDKFEKMIWAFLIGCFYVGCVGHATGRIEQGRLEGVGMADSVDSNDAAAGLLTAIPILLFYLLYGKLWQKIAALAFLPFILDTLVLLNSRGATIGLAISMAYMAYQTLFKAGPTRQKIQMIGIMFFGIALFFRLADATFWERFLTLKEVSASANIGLEGGGASRTYFWLKAVDLAHAHPFGVGGWGYQFLSPQFLSKEMLTGTAFGTGMRAIHSTYFEVLAEYGYLGVVLFAGYLFSSFRLTARVRRNEAVRKNYYLYYQSTAIAAGFFGFLVASTFIDRLYAELLYWFPLFIACFYNIYLLKGHAFEPRGVLQQIDAAMPGVHGSKCPGTVSPGSAQASQTD